MKATGEHVVLSHIHEGIISKAGLDLSNELVNEQKFFRANVLAIGDKTENIKVGDVVWYDINRSHRIVYHGDDVLIVNYQNIAIIE